MDIDNLAAEFEHIEKQISLLLNAEPAVSDEKIKELDKELSYVFDALLMTSLTESSDRISRVKFFLSLIRKYTENSELSLLMLDQIEADISVLGESSHRPKLAIVSNIDCNQEADVEKLMELCYSSRSSECFDQAALSDLKLSAIEYNLENDITGVLTYDQGSRSFFQVLEGTESSIEALMSKILCDPRHHSIKVRFQAPIVNRSYSKWAMCTLTLDEVRGQIKQTNSFSKWFDAFVELDPNQEKTRGHQWMTNSLSSILFD